MSKRTLLASRCGWFFCLICCMTTLWNVATQAGNIPQTPAAMERSILVRGDEFEVKNGPPVLRTMTALAVPRGPNLNRSQPVVPVHITSKLHRLLVPITSSITGAATLATVLCLIALSFLLHRTAVCLSSGASSGWIIGTTLSLLQVMLPTNDLPPGLVGAVLVMYVTWWLTEGDYPLPRPAIISVLGWIGYGIVSMLAPWTFEFGWFYVAVVALLPLLGNKSDAWKWALLTTGIASVITFLAWHDTVGGNWWYREAVISGVSHQGISTEAALGHLPYTGPDQVFARLFNVATITDRFRTWQVSFDFPMLLIMTIWLPMTVVSLLVRFDNFATARYRLLVCSQAFITLPCAFMLLSAPDMVQLIATQVPIFTLMGMGLWGSILGRRAWAVPHMFASASTVASIIFAALAIRSVAKPAGANVEDLRSILLSSPKITEVIKKGGVFVSSNPVLTSYVTGCRVYGLPSTRQAWTDLSKQVNLETAPIILEYSVLNRGARDPWAMLYQPLDNIWEAMSQMKLEDRRLMRDVVQIRIPTEINNALRTSQAEIVEFRPSIRTVVIMTQTELAKQ